MTDRTSRHFELATYRHPVTPGDETGVELFEPRFVSSPAGVVSHTVESGDRLDLLAHHYLGDPHRYWQIADANPGIAFEDLLEPGRVLVIPERG